MPCDVSMQNQPAQISLSIDNRNADKAVIMVRLLLHREIKATGRSISGQDLLFEDKQVVGLAEQPYAVAAHEPNVKTCQYSVFQKKVDKAAQDYEVWLSSQQNRNSQVCWKDVEKNRMFLYGDMDRGIEFSAVSKQIQHEIICSMDTPNIQVSYHVEIQVCHEGTFGIATNEVPGIFFPFIITRDSKGAIDQGT